MAKAMEITFAIGAALTGGFGSVFGKAGQTLSQLQKQTQALQQTSGQIGDFQKLQNAIKGNQTAMLAAQSQAKALDNQISSSTQKTAQLREQYKASQSEISRLSAELGRNKDAYAAAQLNADSLKRQIQKSTGPTAELQKQYAQAQAEVRRLGGAVKQSESQLKTAQATTQRLNTEIRNSAQQTKTLQNEQKNLNSTANQLQSRLDRDREALSRMRTELTGAGVDTRNLASEQSRLTQQSQRLADAQARLSRSRAALEATKQNLSFNNIKGDLMTAAGLGLSLAAPVKQAGDFQQAMARVQAVAFTGKNKSLEQQAADAEALARLTEQARQLGRDTQYTATQAAQSQENLARAGFKANEIIAAMPGLLNMAAAEGMDLSNAADIAASTLRGFNLSADQSNRVADVLAQTSAASNTSIALLGESMKYVAPVASGLGVSIEETAAMLGIMANAGIKGSQAGTALRAAFNRLSKEPKAVEKALHALGIATRDAQGNLRKMPGLMQDLAAKMKNMGSGDRMKYLTNIFGQEAAAGMLAVMEASVNGSLQNLERLNQGADGVSKQMADVMNNTMQGAFTRLGSATESLMIDIGNVLLPTVQKAVDVFTGWTSGLSQLAQEYPRVTKVLVGGVAAIAGYKVAVTGLRIAWNLTKLPFQHARVAFDWLNVKLLQNEHASLFAAAKTKVLTGAQKSWQLVMKGGKKLLDAGKLALYYGKQILITTATKAWTAAQWLWNAALTANPIGLIITAIAGAIAIGYALYKNWDKLKAWWESWTIKDVFAALKDYAKKAYDWVKQKWDDFWAWWDTISLGDIFEPVKDFASGAWDWIKQKWQSLVNWWDSLSLSDIFAGVKNFASGAYDCASQKWEEFKVWWDSWSLSDIFAGVKNFASGAKEWVNNKWQEFSAWWESVSLSDIFSGVKNFASGAKEWVSQKWEEFKVWWESVSLKDIFSGVKNFASGAKEWVSQKWQEFSAWWDSSSLSDIFSSVKDFASSAKDWVNNKWQEFSAYWESLSLSDIFAGVKNFASNAWDFVKSKWQDYINWWGSLLLGDLWQPVKDYASSAKEWASQKWQEFSSWWESVSLSDVFSSVKDYASVAKDWVSQKWQSLANWWESLSLKDIFSPVKDFASGSYNWVTQKWREFGAWWDSFSLSDIFSGSFTGIFDTLTKEFESTKTILSGGWQAVKSLFTLDFTGMWDGILTTFDGIKSFLKTRWESLTSIFKINFGGIWDGLVSGLTTVCQTLEKIWDNTIGVITRTAKGAADIVKGAWDWTLGLVGFGPDENSTEAQQEALKAQVKDITVLNKMSEGFADRVAEMTAAWEPFKSSLGEGFTEIFNVMQGVADKIRSVTIPAVNELVSALSRVAAEITSIVQTGNLSVKVNAPTINNTGANPFSRMGGGQNRSPRFAAGGFVKGLTHAIVGEAGLEAIIPLTDKSRGSALWFEAGRQLGLLDKSGVNYNAVPDSQPAIEGVPLWRAAYDKNFAAPQETNNISNNSQPVFSPVINLTVNGGESGIEDKIRSVINDLFEDAFMNFQNSMQRVAFT